jgi:hypothetical protein
LLFCILQFQNRSEILLFCILQSSARIMLTLKNIYMYEYIILFTLLIDFI